MLSRATDADRSHARARIQAAAATLLDAQADGTRTAWGAARDRRDEVIREAYLDGINTHEIVQLFEESGWPIARITVTRAHRAVERPPLFDTADAVERYRNGESPRDLARAYGCGTKAVTGALRRAGVEIRDRETAKRVHYAREEA